MEKKQVSISHYFNNSKISNFLVNQIGDKKDSFVSNLIALTDADTKLSECEPEALMKCALNATALNLPLNKNLGFAYVIAYKGVPQFQLGYKGFIQLAIRSGQYKTINAVEVREGEIKRNKFTGEITFYSEKPENEIIGYLSYLKMLNGFEQSVYMTTEQVTNHAKKFSKNYAYNNSIWKSDFEGMAKKTVLKLLLNKYGVLSTEIQSAILEEQKATVSKQPTFKKLTSTEIITQDGEIIEQKEPAKVDFENV